jgi:hypothetical protein
MTPDEAHLEALVSLAENGIKSEIMISSCGGDEVMSAYSNCVFYMVSHVVFRDSRMVQV